MWADQPSLGAANRHRDGAIPDIKPLSIEKKYGNIIQPILFNGLTTFFHKPRTKESDAIKTAQQVGILMCILHCCRNAAISGAKYGSTCQYQMKQKIALEYGVYENLNLYLIPQVCMCTHVLLWWGLAGISEWLIC